MGDSLATTNVMLGIIAVVSLLQGILIVGGIVGVFLIYRRVMEVVNGLESRQIAPAMARVNAILDDIKGVSETVKVEADRMDQAIHDTIAGVEQTVDRVRSGARAGAGRVVGVVRGARAAVSTLITGT